MVKELRIYYINRDILECKCCTIYNGSATFVILIETYWNVNVKRKIVTMLLLDINRDILECKLDDYRYALLAKYHINRDILECK